MPEMMKAALIEAFNQPLTIGSIPIPQPGPNDVLVQTKACGICGTDMHIADGWGYDPPLPYAMGHEPAGVVVEKGANVTRFKVGDRVLPNIFYSCGDCYYCRVGRETMCLNLHGILGIRNYTGGYAEYFIAPERQLFILPDEISFEEGAVIADAVVTASHAVRRGRVTQGENVLIISSGGLASAAIQICKTYGARVIVSVLNEEKAARAKELGADDVVIARRADEFTDAIKALTNSVGVACALDAVGTEQTLGDSVNSLSKGGRLVMLGFTHERYPVAPRQMIVNEIELIGTRSGSRQDTVESLQHVARSTWIPIVTDRFPIEQVNEAHKMFRAGTAQGRIVLIHG